MCKDQKDKTWVVALKENLFCRRNRRNWVAEFIQYEMLREKQMKTIFRDIFAVYHERNSHWKDFEKLK